MLFTSAVSAEEPSAGRPEMHAFELQLVPKLDGEVLDDPAWQGVTPATGFWQVQPDEGQPATQKTEVFIGFLDDALYVGVVAYDDDPEGIIATDPRRDSQLNDTDSFRVIIDGLLDRQNGFVFGTNPLGMEYDAQVVKEGAGGRWNNSGFNLNWDASWSVEARISDIGWSAEMRIPFKTLRYGPDDEQTWGINFQRNIRRNYEIAYWAPLTMQYNLNRVSEAGTITGIRPFKSRNLSFTPYALGKAQRGGELDGTETDVEFGFDAKYAITPSLTLDVTYNTDFAQVEADYQQVNLDRFNLFFPEKRPFFLENSGQFTVGNARAAQLFFSRRIGIGEDGDVIPIDGGVRLSGKVGGSTNVGLLYMSSEAVEGIAPGNEFTVARINQEFGNRSSIGAIYVERDGDGSFDTPEAGDNNRAYGIDGRLGIGENTLITGWAAKTDTPTLDGDDHAYSLKANYDSAEWSHGIEYAEVGEDFNPEVGFLTRDGYRKFATNSLKRIRPDDFLGMMEIRPHYSYRAYWDFDDFKETSFLHLDVHWEWQNGYELHTGYNIFTDGIKEAFEIVDDVWIQPGTYYGNEVQLVFRTDDSAPLSLNLHANIGERFGGDFVALSPTLGYRFGDRFSSSLSANYTDFDLPVPGGDFSVLLTRLRLSYSFTPKILLQALVQYNDQDDEIGTNLRLSWLRTANTGFYIVYNEVNEQGVDALPTGRELILKYSYMFDVFN
ncbi:MAG: DUF5916 domain-containing protein [Lysobacterales bacterium]|jgi:hypothetical protein